jgi:hypothetical protein
MSSEESKLYLGQDPNCKGSNPNCANQEEETENLKNENRQSLYDKAKKIGKWAHSLVLPPTISTSSTSSKDGKKTIHYWNRKSDYHTLLLIVSAIVLIALLLSNVSPSPPYEETTSLAFFYGIFTLLFIIFFFSFPLQEERTTLFQRTLVWSEDTIKNWKIQMQKGIADAYGESYKLVREDGKEIEEKEVEEEEIKDGIFKRAYKFIRNALSISNDDNINNEEEEREFKLKNRILCRLVQTERETYTSYTAHNIIMTGCIFILIYFTFFNSSTSGQWWVITFYPIFLFMYLYHLVYWYSFFTSSFEERDSEETSINGTNWVKILFWIVNISIIIMCVSFFITILFQQDTLASWSLFTMVAFIGLLTLATLEGDTLNDKLIKFSESNGSFKHLTSLIFYMLFFVYFYATPSTNLPPLWKSFYKSVYKSLGSAFVNNFYSYIFFPLSVLTAFYMLVRATFTQIDPEHGKEVDYNAIRVRFVIIYFLCFVFFATLYFHQSKIPCYVQIFFNSAGLQSKIIFNTIIALFVFGFLLLFSILYSPQDVALKKKHKDTDHNNDPHNHKHHSESILSKLDLKKIIKLIVLLILAILITVAFTLFYLKNSSQLKEIYTKAYWEKSFLSKLPTIKNQSDLKTDLKETPQIRLLNAIVFFIPVFVIIFLYYLIVNFFKKQAVANSSKSIVSTFAHIFFVFGFLGFFTCISILVIYTLIINKGGGIGRSIATYVVLFVLFFLMYKIIVSTAIVQQNPIYKLMVEMVFIIPCLFELYVLPYILNSTIGKYAMETYKTSKFNTSTIITSHIAIVVSQIIIVYYFYSFFTSGKTRFGGLLLMNGPVSIYEVNSPISYNTITLLNSKFSTYNDNSGNYTNEFISTNYQTKYNYAITFWFNIASNPGFDDDQPIVSFGNVPNISYIPNANVLSITINCDNTKTLITIPNIKLQKWCFLAINIDGGTVDVFIDNFLINSQEGVVPYVDTTNSDITVGYAAPATAINASSLKDTFSQVCNFVYYPTTLTITNISDLYNEGKLINPPVNSVAETGDEITPFAAALNLKEMNINAITSTFECTYTDFLEPTEDACSNILDNDTKFDNYISLPWYFLQMGDDTTGNTEINNV